MQPNYYNADVCGIVFMSIAFASVHPVLFMNPDSAPGGRQFTDKPTILGCASACKILSSTLLRNGIGMIVTVGGRSLRYQRAVIVILSYALFPVLF